MTLTLDTHVHVCPNELDIATIGDLITDVTSGNTHIVTLDMTNVTLMDAFALGRILELHRAFESIGSTLILRGLQNLPLRVVRLFQLHSVLNLVEPDILV